MWLKNDDFKLFKVGLSIIVLGIPLHPPPLFTNTYHYSNDFKNKKIVVELLFISIRVLNLAFNITNSNKSPKRARTRIYSQQQQWTVIKMLM